MTLTPEYHVVDIVQAAGGRIVSRIRLQKIAYLLDQLGAHSGFRYTYHHYGPYSADLDSAIVDADAFGLVKEEFGYRKADGARYSIFKANADSNDHQFEYLRDGKMRDLVKLWASTDITVLELAATAHWLYESEKVKDWEPEIERRKGSKVLGGRLEAAKKFLEEAGLPPVA